MSQILDNFSDEEIQFKSPGFSLFFNVWIKPKRSFNVITNQVSITWSFVIMFVLGLATFYNSMWNIVSNLPFQLPLDVAFIAFLSGIAGLLFFSFSAFLFHLCCRIFKCKSNISKAIGLFAWSRIPQLTGTVLLLIFIKLYYSAAQSENYILDGNAFSAIFTGLIRFVFSLWTIIIFIIGIKETYKLNVWKSIIIGILPGVLISMIAFLVSYIYMSNMHNFGFDGL